MDSRHPIAPIYHIDVTVTDIYNLSGFSAKIHAEGTPSCMDSKIQDTTDRLWRKITNPLKTLTVPVKRTQGAAVEDEDRALGAEEAKYMSFLAEEAGFATRWYAHQDKTLGEFYVRVTHMKREEQAEVRIFRKDPEAMKEINRASGGDMLSAVSKLTDYEHKRNWLEKNIKLDEPRGNVAGGQDYGNAYERSPEQQVLWEYEEDMMRRNPCGHDDLYHEIQGQCRDRWGEYRLV